MMRFQVFKTRFFAHKPDWYAITYCLEEECHERSAAAYFRNAIEWLNENNADYALWWFSEWPINKPIVIPESKKHVHYFIDIADDVSCIKFRLFWPRFPVHEDMGSRCVSTRTAVID